MKKVYSAESLVKVAHLRNVLESAGIACCIRNERLSGALGEIPFLECWPELWVLQTQDAPKAQSLIQEELRGYESARTAWTCETCGEWLDGQFTECWRCSSPAGLDESLER
jgi:hypothetical protein